MCLLFLIHWHWLPTTTIFIYYSYENNNVKCMEYLRRATCLAFRICSFVVFLFSFLGEQDIRLAYLYKCSFYKLRINVSLSRPNTVAKGKNKFSALPTSFKKIKFVKVYRKTRIAPMRTFYDSKA